MKTAILKVEMFFPGGRSLKQKRSPLKSMLAKLRNRFNCSVAEVDYQDSHQRAAIGISVVSSDAKNLEGQLAQIREFLMLNPDFRIQSIAQEFYNAPQADNSWGLE